MTYVVTEACMNVKDGTCVDVCPVDCIYEGGRMFYIQPDECVNCGICVSVCPVEAIFADDRLPEIHADYIGVNREFFGDAVTGWGIPGGLSDAFRTEMDHPLVTAKAPRPPQ